MKNNIRTIAGQLPFADTLARWVLNTWGGDPLALSRALMLAPSRRAAQSLREAFLRVGGGRPMLLPRIEPLGDTGEDALLLSSTSGLLTENIPLETFTYQRLFLLTQLVKRQRERLFGYERTDHALALAVKLAQLLDECEREEISLEGLKHIVPDAMASHWQKTLEFLQIISVHWPQIAEAQGLVSPGAHQRGIFRALAQRWRQFPPDYPVIVVGVTASYPATAELMAAILDLPDGHIVLPGFDCDSDDGYFAALSEGHPQYGMARLLQKLGHDRADVLAIGHPADARVKLLTEVMRPAETSARWLTMDIPHAEALRGMEFVDCANLQEEATVIALMLRETLETPGKTAALVTPHRGLAKRVATIMQRFGVTIDDSAGMPLKQTPLVTFLRLILVAESQAMSPLVLLSLLKHPLTHAGMERIILLETARELEIRVLRGLSPGTGIEALRQACLKHSDAMSEIHVLLDKLEVAFEPLFAVMARKEVTLGACVNAHLDCAESLGGSDMWSGPEADVFSETIRMVRAACNLDNPVIEPQAYTGMFEELLSDRVVRPQYGTHPRLKILSPLEARMQSFDRTILSGLNEGIWPPAPESDSWFSRPMRASLGLPAPERKTGLSAHDFFMLAVSPEVILTRSSKDDGVPLMPSRWLVKLEMLAGALPRRHAWLAWARQLDAPDEVTPVPPPAPKPPVSARPRDMSVTKVETWMRDPYSIYASEILRLRALPPLGRTPDGSDFGNAVHKALERFVHLHPSILPPDSLPVLLSLGRLAFSELFSATSMEILWWPRFVRIAEWIIALESQRRPLEAAYAEVEGACRIGEFLLHGRADRVEKRAEGITIIDYKTGGVPSGKDIESGLSSQLVLLALITREKGLKVTGDSIALEYWQLQGGDDAGNIRAIKQEKIEEYIEEARKGLARLILKFSDPDFPYRSVPIPSRASRYSDYDRLARVKEWG